MEKDKALAKKLYRFASLGFYVAALGFFAAALIGRNLVYSPIGAAFMCIGTLFLALSGGTRSIFAAKKGAMNDKDIVKRFYEDVVTNNRLDRVGDYISPDCVVRVGSDVFPVGVEGMKEHIAATKATYPDYTMNIIRQYRDGNTVISEFCMTGTHKGVYLGIAPTGKTVSITGVDIDTVVDGKIVEHGGAANTFEAFWKNGLIKPV